MNIYLTNLTYELPINRNDYLRVSIDLTVDRNNFPQKEEIIKGIENIFNEIIKTYNKEDE